MGSQEIWIPSVGNQRLKTYLQNSRREGNVIIFCHGFTGGSRGLFSDPLAEALSKTHFVCRFDFRGQGRSEGRFFDTSITRELEDLGAIIAYLRECYVPKRYILLGHSFGAAIAILYASQHRVDGLVSISGEGDLEKAIPLEFSQEQLDEMEKTGKTAVVNYSLDGATDLLGKQFLDDMRKYSTVKAVGTIQCPALFVHGLEDEVISVDVTNEMFNSTTSQKELIIVPGADHCYNAFTDKPSKIAELHSHIFKWLRQQEL